MGIYYCETEGCAGLFRSIDHYYVTHAPFCKHYVEPTDEKKEESK